MASNDFSDELFRCAAAITSGAPASQQLRDTVLRQTTRTIRNRRRMRQVKIAGALAACYMGGIATMSVWSSPRGIHSDQQQSMQVSTQDSDPSRLTARKPMRPEDDQLADIGKPQSSLQLTAYERLCRAGDEQLKNQDGLVAAARSYKKALQLATLEQRSIDPDRDTWLLMAMKQSIN